MKLLQRLGSKVCLSILAFVLVGSNAAFAQQGPGGVGAFSSWQQGSDNSELVNNYATIDLLDFTANTDVEALALEGASTLFFVLQTKQPTQTGALFLRLGDISVYDDHITYGRGSVSLTSKHNQEPRIIAIEMQRPRPVGFAPNTTIEVGDTSLFSMAELIVYNGKLSREERRKVNTYLALKYSVPITKNEQPQWRNYLTSAQGTYWNTTQDFVYGENVIALGRSDAQALFQSQTRTASGGDLMLALDGFVLWGDMPKVSIVDESFVVFSQREDQGTSSLLCGDNEQHPLYSWKFHLQDWHSDAENMVLRVKHPETIEKLPEVYITDGAEGFAIPLLGYACNHALYKIPFDKLENGRHYFFTSSEGLKTCERITVECQRGIVSVQGDLMTEGWTVELSSLTDDQHQAYSLGAELLQIHCPEGQQLLSLRNAQGVLQTTVAIDGSWCKNQSGQSTAPLLRASLFPNPVGSGRDATLLVEGLTKDIPVEISVMNALGSIVSNETINGKAMVEYNISLEVAGVYIVRAIQGDKTVTLRLVVE